MAENRQTQKSMEKNKSEKKQALDEEVKVAINGIRSSTSNASELFSKLI